jgi:hypothetical protein
MHGRRQLSTELRTLMFGLASDSGGLATFALDSQPVRG